jgi:hypothetical protein
MDKRIKYIRKLVINRKGDVPMLGYYCYANEIDGTLTCYYTDEICTYYPDGSVNCVPRVSIVPWPWQFQWRL